MSNLFIVHSEFQLIIAHSVILQYFPDSKNDLILFARESETGRNDRIKSIFRNVIILDANEPTETTITAAFLRELTRLLQYRKVKRSSISKEYYKFIFSPYFDTLLMKKIISLLIVNNSMLLMSYIEEGSGFFYTSEGVYSKISSFNKANKTLTLINIIKRLRKYYFNIGYTLSMDEKRKDYENCTELYVRGFLQTETFDSRITHSIDYYYFNNAVTSLFYNENYIINKKRAVLVIFDGENIYDPYDEKFLRQLICNINKFSSNTGIEIYAKKHPRYSNYLNGLDCSYIDLGNDYPAEYYLVNMQKNTIIIGGTSTALTTATSIGLETYSYSNLLLNDEQKIEYLSIIEYLKKFNVKILKSYDEFNKLLESLN